ncbi:MAG: ABC transporter substrate-binding protein [bacterium]|nr:ABC transporter substrate-binding protein [bacterium]
MLLTCSVAIAGPVAAEVTADYLRPTAKPGRSGGALTVALRAEPKTFNPVVAVDNPSFTVVRRLMADLIHIDRATQETTAALARSWSVSPDGRRYTLELRRGILFSDGHPLDADDVVFTFGVYLDEEVGSPHRDFLIVADEPIVVEKLDSHTVAFTLAEPYAVGERLFDSIPILPRHLLQHAYREGRFGETWQLSTPAEQIAGLGPFRLEKYVPGERLEMVRNPHYWKVDRTGQRLPYLERLTFLFVASEDAQTLRFQAGDTHLTNRLSAKSYAVLDRERGSRGYTLEDLGPGLGYTFLFFNLNDLREKELPEIERKQAWFRQVAFRRAVSATMDRAGIARLVYQGRATPIASHVSPGNKQWANRALEPPERSLEAARALLREAGFTWDEDGKLRDAGGEPVAFSLLTSSSNEERKEIATIVQDDLGQLGLRVDVVPLEFRAMLDRIFRGHDYDACVLAFGGGDVDPNSAIPTITSGGQNHLWRLLGEPPPWQVEIDRLMDRQLTTIDPVERKRLYDRVQELAAQNLPMIFLVSPNVLAGAAPGLGNFSPAILDHFTLWNADELYWRSDGGS